MRSLFLALLACLLVTGGNARAQSTVTVKWVGVGVILSTDGKYVIKRLVPSGPALESGMKVNDRIVRVDGTSVEGMAMAQVLGLLHGEEGTLAKIIVARPGAATPLAFAVMREPIHVEVKAKDSSPD